ncbi:extracellular matrix regulator RemB [Desmospora activa]|uniref:Uncharacterized protein DUF370 n=1 Tax=Desmospora activa DSM 45169 TaxID=1121389 RepID=A0A2T4Z4U5_9BACL|nr:extracellular matrix/biofilm biosynthesis regulator RemA family protein [Desmospora activa]PTM56913.1 uncharacterized protein DUF370 [Desmospora activa DSM 45169]
MFIHLGGNKMIRTSEVITILDAGSRVPLSTLQPFLEKAKEQGCLEEISAAEEIKSYVVTAEMIYASPISSLTLMKRGQPENTRILG